MLDASVSILLVLLGAGLGFAFRTFEFRREKRLEVYGTYVARFLAVTRIGASMQSAYFVHGEGLWSEPKHGDLFGGMLTKWAEVLFDFQDAAAQFHLIAGRHGRRAARQLDAFVEENILRVPPHQRYKDPDTTTWGSAAQVGPREVEAEGVRVAMRFTEEARPDISRFSGRRRPGHDDKLANGSG